MDIVDYYKNGQKAVLSGIDGISVTLSPSDDDANTSAATSSHKCGCKGKTPPAVKVGVGVFTAIGVLAASRAAWRWLMD